mgnify:FL=1|tara:strand:- start:31 stop:210 length:180 start_codon:yes stop_codon:yes gene_type:complete
MTEKQLKKREATIRRIHNKLTKRSAPAEDGYALVEPENNDVQEELERLSGYQAERNYNG